MFNRQSGWWADGLVVRRAARRESRSDSPTNEDGFLASRKRSLLVVLPIVLAALASGVWFVWLREPSRELPPEFMRRSICEDAKLSKLLIPDKGLVIAGAANGDVFEASQADDVARVLPPGGDAAVTLLALSSDGLLLAGDDSGLLRAWQLPGRKFKSLESPKIPATCAAFRSLDGRLQIYLGLSDGRLVMVDDDGSKVFNTKHRGIKSMALSPDQKTIATAGTEGLITFFAAEKLDELSTLKHHATEVAGLAWSIDGKSLASGDWNGEVAIASADSRQVIATGKQHDAVSRLVWSGEQLVTGSWDGRIRKWSVGSNELKVVSEVDTKRAIHDLAMSTEVDTVVTVSGNDAIEFWKLP